MQDGGLSLAQFGLMAQVVHIAGGRPLAADEIFGISGDAFGEHDDAEVIAAALGRLSGRQLPGRPLRRRTAPASDVGG